MSNLTDRSNLPSPKHSTGELAEPSSSSPSDSEWNYEATVAQIEAIINRIEMGELELAEVFDQFAIAVHHLRRCEAFLNRQKGQIDLLIETLIDEPDSF
jgi:exodeoxyribonuclease VII small subunit